MKSWYKSRTLWVNAVAAVAMFVQQQFGFAVPAELQMYFLTLLNVVLRFDTKEAVGK